MIRRRNKDERGAALVEAAIGAILMLSLLLMIAWGALLLRSYLSVTHAATLGTRAASIAGDDKDADFAVLDAVKPAVTALGSGSLQRVIVYRAMSPEQGPPQTCLDGIASVDCNIYTASDMNRPATHFKPGGPISNDDNYTPDSRATLSSASTYIGVYVEAKPGLIGFPNLVPEKVGGHDVMAIETRLY